MNFPTIGRRVMLLNARQVFDEDGEGSALLLAIEDVTERRDTEREKDELLRQKEVLLQEMQHRVANSLQIIAGNGERSKAPPYGRRTGGTPEPLSARPLPRKRRSIGP